MAAPGVSTASPWAPRRRRAELLRERHPFAVEMLTLYLALLAVWEEAADAAGERQPDPGALAGWAARRVLPAVAEATAGSTRRAAQTASAPGSGCRSPAASAASSQTASRAR